MIICKIDVTKIDKAKLFKGAKGTYLDVVLMENRDGTDQYGNDFMVVQGVSKEERAAGVRGAILGNGRIVKTQARMESKSESVKPPVEDDDIPF